MKGILAEFIGEAQDDPNAIKNEVAAYIWYSLVLESIINNPAFRNILLSTPYKERMVALTMSATILSLYGVVRMTHH